MNEVYVILITVCHRIEPNSASTDIYNRKYFSSYEDASLYINRLFESIEDIGLIPPWKIIRLLSHNSKEAIKDE